MGKDVDTLAVTQFGSVQKWLEDLRLMTETECMCILQGKSLMAENTALSPTQNIKNGIDAVRDTAHSISTAFAKLFRRVEKERWKHLKLNCLHVTCHIRSLIHECNGLLPDPPPHIVEQQEIVMGECAKLLQLVDSMVANNNITTLHKVPLVNQMTFLGQAFSRLVDLVLGYLVQLIIHYIEEATSHEHVNTAISTLIRLSLEGDHMCYIVAREGGVRALFDICRHGNMRLTHAKALRAIATVCCVPESIIQTERVGGIACLTELLCSDGTTEEVKGEAAGVIAQVTSPCLDQYQHIIGFVDSMDMLLKALTALCDISLRPEVFLLSSAAIANITFMDSMACDFLLRYGTASVLIEAASLKKANTIFAKDQIATVLANMAALDICRTEICRNDGIELLIQLLQEQPSRLQTEAEISACERVQQKAAIALTRLSREMNSAEVIVKMHGIPRLVQLCRETRCRNNSDAVLVACLAALRKISSNVGLHDMSSSDIQQLIKPRLMDSFLMCTHKDENFV